MGYKWMSVTLSSSNFSRVSFGLTKGLQKKNAINILLILISVLCKGQLHHQMKYLILLPLPDKPDSVALTSAFNVKILFAPIVYPGDSRSNWRA